MGLDVETEESVRVFLQLSGCCVRPLGGDCVGYDSSSGPVRASTWPGPP